MNDTLVRISNLIEKNFHREKMFLEETKSNMKIQIDGRNVDLSVFSFDVDLSATEYPKGLFPFFHKGKGVHSVCDYMLWVYKNGEIYILLIELKKGKDQTGPQLKAGKVLANFIVQTYNRVNKMNIIPKIRMISIHNINIQKKGSIKVKPIKYNSENMVSFKGNRFCVIDFLK